MKQAQIDTGRRLLIFFEEAQSLDNIFASEDTALPMSTIKIIAWASTYNRII